MFDTLRPTNTCSYATIAAMSKEVNLTLVLIFSAFYTFGSYFMVKYKQRLLLLSKIRSYYLTRNKIMNKLTFTTKGLQFFK